MPRAKLQTRRLADLLPGEDSTCYALFGRKEARETKAKKPYWICEFRDAESSITAKIWSDSPLHEEVGSWVEGTAYRLLASVKHSDQYGADLLIREIRPATEADRDDGFDPSSLYPCAIRPPAEVWPALRKNIDEAIDDPFLKTLVLRILDEHQAELETMQAATGMHHAYVGGLLEHIGSLTRLARFVADHYGAYYNKQLDPPLNRSLIVATIVLHDIGKLIELSFQPAGASYTTKGRLLGHIVMGRDLVREAAASIPDFPQETLLALEHAILAHHGRREFGSPVEPQTLEALIVSYLDELDAKVNSVAMELRKASRAGAEWTERIRALDGRKFHRGARESDDPDTEATDG